MKIFVISFSLDKSLIDLCTKNDNVVAYEQMDGGQAYKTVKEMMPDIIVVNYKDKPSHGRLTALKINERKSTSKIPIVFLDGSDKDNEKIMGFGDVISKDKLLGMIR